MSGPRRRSSLQQRRSAKLERRHGRSDLFDRIKWAIPAVAFAIWIVSSGGWIFAAGATALGLVALHELFGMYDRVRPVRLAGMLGLVALAVAAQLGDERQVLLAAMAFFPILFLVALAMPRGGPTATARMSLTAMGVFWIGMAIAHAIMLRNLDHGGGILVDILVATFIGDTGAYLGGRAFGTRKLAPSISPNKTVEGLVIGMFFAVMAGWAAGLYQDWLTHGQALLIGLTAAIAAPLGDLFESQVKRDAGTKDAGGLFGPHGGALDRLDAALFALVAGYYVWLAMLGG
jgi:phosphatidate cytidylyltransferase